MVGLFCDSIGGCPPDQLSIQCLDIIQWTVNIFILPWTLSGSRGEGRLLRKFYDGGVRAEP